MRVNGRTLAWFAGLVLSTAGIARCQGASGADTVLRHAIQLHQSGDIAAAISEYRSYLDQVPDNVMARSNLGAALARSGRFEEASFEYQKALEVQPGNLPVRLNLALAYYKASEFSRAAAELERVLEPGRDRQPVLLLADCYLRLGENKKVIDLLSPLQQATPDDKALDYLLGTALIRDGQAAPGQLLVDRILRDGDSPEGRLMIANPNWRRTTSRARSSNSRKPWKSTPNCRASTAITESPWQIQATSPALKRRSAKSWPRIPTTTRLTFNLANSSRGMRTMPN